jgi:hypothetical protein
MTFPMDAIPSAGPIALCAVICSDITRASGAYEQHMGLKAGAEFNLDTSTSAALGFPDLAGAPARLLSNSAGRAWLLQVEYPQAQPRDALNSFGWLAQEVLVEDVDGLASQLDDTPFTLLRPPRDLDVSNTIRACQVRGTDGEILYLTQVNGEVEGSQLPQNAQGVDHLFIAVLSTPDREASLHHYEAIAGTRGTSFETRISVVNQHRGWDLEKRHPIATLQLAGESLIEIDELVDTQAAPDGICAGTAAIVFYAKGPAPEHALPLEQGPLAGYAAVAGIGIAGERYTLLYGANN